ncbi:MAG: 6-carboxytetrahydropterin synthase [Phycisphaerales bacterium]|nr:6-carboxytetrahydropterin synthase [Phycisphaerales bacterium]
MYRLQVERRVRATHAIVIAGELETPHEHDWRIRVQVSGPTLDSEGLLCDFHVLEQQLDRLIKPFHDADLNATPPFDKVNPTAEHVAQFIAEGMADGAGSAITRIEAAVTEAPGCEAFCTKTLHTDESTSGADS